MTEMPTQPSAYPAGSILGDIKKMLGVDSSIGVFDTEIIIGINSAFMFINQLGVGPATPYVISGMNDRWSDFMPLDGNKFQAVKTYIYLRTRLSFDPPTVGAVMTSFENQIKEYEWRLTVQATPPIVQEVNPSGTYYTGLDW